MTCRFQKVEHDKLLHVTHPRSIAHRCHRGSTLRHANHKNEKKNMFRQQCSAGVWSAQQCLRLAQPRRNARVAARLSHVGVPTVASFLGIVARVLPGDSAPGRNSVQVVGTVLTLRCSFLDVRASHNTANAFLATAEVLVVETKDSKIGICTSRELRKVVAR